EFPDHGQGGLRKESPTGPGQKVFHALPEKLDVVRLGDALKGRVVEPEDVVVPPPEVGAVAAVDTVDGLHLRQPAGALELLCGVAIEALSGERWPSNTSSLGEPSLAETQPTNSTRASDCTVPSPGSFTVT